MTNLVFTSKIPDNWLKEAGVEDFKTVLKAYKSDSTTLIPLSEIQPPKRNPGIKYFERDRMMKILKGFSNDATIPPIQVNEMSNPRLYKYRLHDGLHRFYASLAVGYEYIPVQIIPYFDIHNM